MRLSLNCNNYFRYKKLSESANGAVSNLRLLWLLARSEGLALDQREMNALAASDMTAEMLNAEG